MRFHVVSLPHTNTLNEGFSTCAYTTKVRKFCQMMSELGHDVFLYAGEYNDAPCTEHEICITDYDRKKIVEGIHYVQAPFHGRHWDRFNAHAIAGMERRLEPHDFICLIAGAAQKQIADAYPNNMTVEFGIGYGGSFSKYRVFESYAWMHMTYGAQAPNLHIAKGDAFHAVIPNYLDVKEFPYNYHKLPYYAFLGRIVELKGFHIAIEACKRAGKELRIAGPAHGYDLTPASYVGELGVEARGKFLSEASALFVPTQYIEPFGTVAIEAMMCGTPVITSDWGAFTETVKNGFNGYRCHTLQDYMTAMKEVNKLDPYKIRKHAVENYSMRVIAKKYEAYFEQLLTLWNEGWYKLKEAA